MVHSMRPYQADAISAVEAAWQEHNNVLLVAATGAGKAQPLDAQILTDTGFIAMRDVRIGSRVIGQDGLAHNVIGVYPQGVKPVYRMTFADKTSTECCIDHLWSVQTKSQKSRESGFIVKPTAELINDLYDGSGARKWFLPVVSPVEFAESNPLPIDPYVLGILLGDGCFTQDIRFSSADEFIVHELRQRLPLAEIVHIGGFDYLIRYPSKGPNTNPLTTIVRRLGLFGCNSFGKFVPQEYLFASIEDRISLLRGLMDSDGTADRMGRSAEFCTTSQRLANDICFLIRSLGGLTNIRTRSNGFYTYKGEVRKAAKSYRISANLIGINPFLLPRKASLYNISKTTGVRKSIESIEYVRDADCQCIMVDGPDHLYVTDDFIVTHNTQMFLRILVDALGDTKRGLIIAHRQELIDQPVERLRQIAPEWIANIADRPRIGIVMAERNECNRQLTVATIQTLSSKKRLDQLLAHGPIDVLVVDETHHATAATYMKLYQALKEVNPELKLLGVTATPQRADGDGLSKVFDHVAAKITIADLVKLGWLVKPRWLGIKTGISLAGVKSNNGDFVASQLAAAMDTPQGQRLIVESYQKFATERKAIAFTASVQGAHDLAAAFCKAGIRAQAIDASTPKEDRRTILGDFRAGRIQILTNCQVLTEGFDAPGTSCILMCRPTQSDGLYCQMIGRGFRPKAGRALPDEDCLILDFMPKETRNIVCAGDVLGLPKEMTERVKKEQEQLDLGDVIAGFTFDGEHFETGGTPLEIVARQLNYLDVSPYAWHRDGDTLTLGLGPGSDRNDRILAIIPVDVREDQYSLYGLLRKPTSWQGDRPTYGPWQSRLVATGSLEALGNEAQAIADKWQSPLNAKERSWRSYPASDSQLSFLRKLAKGRIKPTVLDNLTKGQCAEYLSHYIALQALKVG